MPHAPRVLVVGAGPTGLTAAVELARHGVPCRLIDRLPAPVVESRALAVQARTLETFVLMGVAREVVSRGVRVAGVSIYGHRGRRLARLDLSRLDSPFPFVLVLPQARTERILLAAAERRGVGVERPVELSGVEQDPGGVTARLRRPDGSEETTRFDWLLGCDGAHSGVREALGLPFAGKTFDLRFLLADVRAETALPPDEAHIAARDDGILAVFPLPGGGIRLVADNPPPRPDDLDPTLEEWQALADRRAPSPIRLREAFWTSDFRIHSRMVERFRVGRVFLLGDAAHIHSPALGQGMNTGIQDAANLAWKVAHVARGADPALLDSYDAERRPVAEDVLRETGVATRLMTSSNPIVEAAREHLLPRLSGLAPLQRRARRLVSQLRVAYRASPAVAGSGVTGGPRSGDRAPDARVTDAAGRETSLLTTFARPGYTLLALGGPGAIDAARRAGGGPNGLVQAYAIVGRAGNERAGRAAPALVDHRSEVAAHYGRRPALYLVRPDGYLAFAGPPEEVEALLAFLRRWLPRTGRSDPGRA